MATKLTLGAPYVPSETTAAVARIMDLLKRNGFYNAGVEPATSTREATQEVHIDFHADPGDRAKFDGLVASGDTLRPSKNDAVQRLEALRGWLGLAPAHRNAPPKRTRQHSLLVSQARSSAGEVKLVKLDYHADTNTVTPELASTAALRCWCVCAAPSFCGKATQPAAHL